MRHAMDVVYARVPITLIREHDHARPRGPAVQEDGGGERLLRLVVVSRWIQCLLVRQAPVGYWLIDGRARLAAASSAGEKEIDVAIVDVDEPHAALLAAAANFSCSRLTPIASARLCNALAELLNAGGGVATQQRVAAALGRSQAWVSGQLQVARKLSDEVLSDVGLAPEALESASLATLRALSHLPRNQAQERLIRAAREIRCGAPARVALVAAAAGMKERPRGLFIVCVRAGELKVSARLERLERRDAEECLRQLAPHLRCLADRADAGSLDTLLWPTCKSVIQGGADRHTFLHRVREATSGLLPSRPRHTDAGDMPQTSAPRTTPKRVLYHGVIIVSISFMLQGLHAIVRRVVDAAGLLPWRRLAALRRSAPTKTCNSSGADENDAQAGR